jgi:hypothetical protein
MSHAYGVSCRARARTRYRPLAAGFAPVGLLGPPLPRAMQGIRRGEPTIPGTSYEP